MSKEALIQTASSHGYKISEEKGKNLIFRKSRQRIIVWADGGQITKVIDGNRRYFKTDSDNIYTIAETIID